MKKSSSSSMLVVIVGALAGMIVGCLITWFPIRLSFCAYYNAPDCEEIVLMVFPLYCFIMPLIGGTITYWLDRRQRQRQDDNNSLQDGTTGKE